MKWKQLAVCILVGAVLMMPATMSATATSGDPATSVSNEGDGKHHIEISDGTIRIQDTHLSGPGLPTTSIDHQTFTVDSSTITFDGITFTIDGHTQTVGQVSITISDIGVVLENVSTSST
ncbi:hypothetical protein ACFFQF_30655 [Haladaptatus pallidirubidus]|uniref:Uncharacterized protein n=1 Tax=Haladaptatus pallidirubidus TaxID=1008152 RepID=A0AAV3UHW0_9EURY|nr:hypothetical protein [Haladaptatus pallidirubidus]